MKPEFRAESLIVQYNLDHSILRTLTKAINDNIPHDKIETWLEAIKKHNPDNPNAYLKKCIKNYHHDQPPKPKKEKHPTPGDNKWTTCHHCIKHKPCSYWNDPVEDVKFNTQTYHFYCDNCYQILIDNANEIYYKQGKPKLKPAGARFVNSLSQEQQLRITKIFMGEATHEEIHEALKTITENSVKNPDTMEHDER